MSRTSRKSGLFSKAAGSRMAVFSLTLVVLVSPFLVSCLPGKEPAGITVRHGEPPALRILCGDQTVTALRNGFRWPSDATIRKVEENPFTPLPGERLFVQPGQEILLRLEGTDRKPGTVTLNLSYHQEFIDPETPRKVIASADINEFSSERGAFAFKWRLPEDIPPAGSCPADTLPEYDVYVTVKWTEPQDAEVKYVAVLASPDESSVKAVLDTCKRFFDAAWSGRKDVLVQLVDPEIANRREDLEGTSFPLIEPSPFVVSLALESPWDLVLWRSGEYSFKLKSDPKVRLRSIHPDTTGSSALAEISYTVEAVETKTGEKSRWDYTETYYLRRSEENWVVREMTRSGVPWQFAGGREKGWDVRVLRQTKANHQVVEIGDFTGVRVSSGHKWSDDGQFFAFIAENFDRKEIWVVRRDGTGFRRLLCLEDLPSAGIRLSDQEMLILDWAPGQHKVRFMVSGHQVAGPHAEEYGHWVGEVDAETGEIRDVAFVPIRSQGSAWPGDVSVTRDRTALMFRNVNDLWRVTFEDGEASLLVRNIRPEGYDLFRLHYSPSGWYAAYLVYAPRGHQVAVYDLRTGEKRLIEIAGARHAFFSGWTLGEMLSVVVADEKEINHGEDSDWPAGARSVRFYDVSGELKAEVFVPSSKNGESIGHWALTPDDKILAFTTGKVVEDGLSSMGDPYLVHEAKEVWIWENPVGNSLEGSRAGSGEPSARGSGQSSGRSPAGSPGGSPRKLADISGIVESMEWGPSNEYLDIWYRVPWDSPQAEQTGVRVSLDGKVTALSRPRPYDSALNRDVLIGSLDGKVYFRREGKEGSRVFAKDPAGNESVLLEGKFWVKDARIDKDALVVVTETSRHALVLNRSRVYLIVPLIVP
ncbi:MAG TPA: hypothetical protein GXX30_02870 [Firmicutes bacterium]|nr:hypothetical protein [Candidatus Fermentithermobacillaceae bacterium]